MEYTIHTWDIMGHRWAYVNIYIHIIVCIYIIYYVMLYDITLHYISIYLYYIVLYCIVLYLNYIISYYIISCYILLYKYIYIYGKCKCMGHEYGTYLR